MLRLEKRYNRCQSHVLLVGRQFFFWLNFFFFTNVISLVRFHHFVWKGNFHKFFHITLAVKKDLSFLINWAEVTQSCISTRAKRGGFSIIFQTLRPIISSHSAKSNCNYLIKPRAGHIIYIFWMPQKFNLSQPNKYLGYMIPARCTKTFGLSVTGIHFLPDFFFEKIIIIYDIYSSTVRAPL